MIFQLFLVGLVIFIFYAIYSVDYEKSYNDPRTYNELKLFKKIIDELHVNGKLTDDEFYEKYYFYKERMKDWEISSGFAEFRKRGHPYWKDYYRRHEERKHKK